MSSLTCFKSYDIRGKLGDELNEDIAYRIGRAYAQYLNPKVVAVGGDARETSPTLKAAVARGLMDGGTDVLDIGLAGTEEIYYAASNTQVDGGIAITASHNPINYNGMKLVRENSKPISNDTGLLEIKKLAEANQFESSYHKGNLLNVSMIDDYSDHLLTYINPNNIKPLKLVVNAGNGAAGHVVDILERKLSKLNAPIEFIKIHNEPDFTFPNGIPNPILPENRADTSNAVQEHNADMGIAWDGDFDRCFFFDENGAFIEGYYIVGLLAEAFLKKDKGAKIIHDPRLTWNTIDTVEENGGTAIQSKTGHAFIKQIMREKDAVYGGEMSAHHYFRDFAYCDSGMIPWLLVAELVSLRNKPLSQLVEDRIQKYPSSGEINRKVADTEVTIALIRNMFEADATSIDTTDGLSMEFEEWRFNLRASNTEPVIRLNVESRGNHQLMTSKTEEILSFLS
ncbi:phosphomannomutase CpsG [Vibrio hannami]|uniref:phosphomannomutase CpsG n=1 Tax=Vibrio hannami TaxID=2717094 RepID=UPI00240FBC55|nr:phosphomannomutase CpsG [Vibrio hannami]MDG3084925.1 phosphomannomutase CpsG [Vibrio hannami]